MLECCECRDDPDNRELIHERDRKSIEIDRAVGVKRGLALRFEEAVLELKLDYARGDLDSVHELEERIEEERVYFTGRGAQL